MALKQELEKKNKTKAESIMEKNDRKWVMKSDLTNHLQTEKRKQQDENMNDELHDRHEVKRPKLSDKAEYPITPYLGTADLEFLPMLLFYANEKHYKWEEILEKLNIKEFVPEKLSKMNSDNMYLGEPVDVFATNGCIGAKKVTFTKSYQKVTKGLPISQVLVDMDCKKPGTKAKFLVLVKYIDQHYFIPPNTLMADLASYCYPKRSKSGRKVIARKLNFTVLLKSESELSFVSKQVTNKILESKKVPVPLPAPAKSTVPCPWDVGATKSSVKNILDLPNPTVSPPRRPAGYVGTVPLPRSGAYIASSDSDEDY